MTTAELTKTIEFEPVNGAGGAWVHGVSLDERDPKVAELLQRKLHEHGVLFFQFDGYLTSEQFMGFAPLFGEVEDGYRLKPKEDTESPFIDSDKTPMKASRIDYFHTDGTPLPNPPQAAILTPADLPPAGGDTMFASMYAAWDALSPTFQRMIDGLEAVHNTKRLPFLQGSNEAVHPLVIRDAVTGRKMLFVNANYTDHIVGLSERESNAILNMLYDHINTPEFHIRVPWKPGRVAVWEERVVQHRGVADFKGPRKLRRLTFIGGRPTA